MASSSPFGVLDFLAWDHDWNDYHYPLKNVRRAAQLMKEAGVGCVRMDFLWSDLEPAPGHFDFGKYDARVECLTDQGLEILGVLHYNPAWRKTPWNAAPILADFEKYARSIVHHFKESISFWEVWNEPDHSNYWQPQDGLQAYSQLLKRIYPVVKEANPECHVLMGGLSNVLSNNLETIYTLAGSSSFDIVNIHPFVSPLASDPLGILRGMIDHTRATMKRHIDNTKPIWITEIGCPGTSQELTWWLGKSPNEIQQADWVRSIYTEVPKWKSIEKIFWAFFRDTPNHFKDGVDSFGLVRDDFTPKPAYAAYQAAALNFEN